MALHTASRHLIRAHGRSDEDALADRTRLSRTQARSWARPLRRPRIARLSPSRKSLRCRLRIPGLRKGDDSPLRTFSHLAICPSRRLQIQRICRRVHNATCRTPSPRCVSASHAPWFTFCGDAPAAARQGSRPSSKLSDTVGLRAIQSDLPRRRLPQGRLRSGRSVTISETGPATRNGWHAYSSCQRRQRQKQRRQHRKGQQQRRQHV